MGKAGLSFMNGRFSFELEHTHPIALLRPRGVLDAYTAPDLRGALLECLTEQPAGLVIDVSDLAVGDDVALIVLASLARESLRWPGTRFAAFGASREFTASLSRLGVAPYVPACPDHATALVELGRWPAPPRRHMHLEPDRSAPGIARAAVQDFCAEWAIDGDRRAAQLVASELVTNAVVHAGTPIDFTLRLVPPHLHIAVRDGGIGQAHILGYVDETSESGRGLLLVDALATSWGNFVPHNGKVVWATVRVRSVSQRSESRADLRG
jgi:anti-anti-sigma regulatory factor/anti-sigma regulatory factor (Ser/Thr protein kinase)